MLNWKFDNKLSTVKIFYILFVFFNIIIISWFMFNQPQHQEKAMKYLIFSLITVVAWTMDFVISKDKAHQSIINVVTIEKETILGKLPTSLNTLSKIFIIIFSVAVFFFISSTQQSIVSSPGFQIVELGSAGTGLLTLAIINSENLFFFGFIAPTLFGLLYFIFRKVPFIAFSGSLLFTSLIFMSYHILAYGFNDMISMLIVFGFGFMNTLWVLIMRNLLFCDAIHFSNNFSVELLREVGF